MIRQKSANTECHDAKYYTRILRISNSIIKTSYTVGGRVEWSTKRNDCRRMMKYCINRESTTSWRTKLSVGRSVRSAKRTQIKNPNDEKKNYFEVLLFARYSQPGGNTTKKKGFRIQRVTRSQERGKGKRMFARNGDILGQEGKKQGVLAVNNVRYPRVRREKTLEGPCYC